MKPLPALKPRERRLALIAVVFIASWALIAWLVQPLWDRLRELHLDVGTHTEKFQAMQRLLEEAPAIERDYERYAPYLQSPDDDGTPQAFMKGLEAMSRRSSVQINLKPHQRKSDKDVTQFEVEIELEGSQPNLLAFLDELLLVKTLITIERLRLSTAPTPGLLRANLLLQRLTLRR